MERGAGFLTITCHVTIQRFHNLNLDGLKVFGHVQRFTIIGIITTDTRNITIPTLEKVF